MASMMPRVPCLRRFWMDAAGVGVGVGGGLSEVRSNKCNQVHLASPWSCRAVAAFGTRAQGVDAHEAFEAPPHALEAVQGRMPDDPAVIMGKCNAIERGILWLSGCVRSSPAALTCCDATLNRWMHPCV